MLTAAGRLGIRSKAGVANIDSSFLYTRPIAVSFSSEVEILEASGFPASDSTNRIAVLDSEVVKETWTLNLSQESLDTLDIQRNLDARVAVGAAAKTVPGVKIITVPSVSPYTVTLTEMSSSAANADVSATILSDLTPATLQRILSAGTVAAGQFKVNASKELEFHSSAAGLQVMVFFQQTTGTSKIIGGSEVRGAYTDLEFIGRLSGPRVPTGLNIWCPRISRISGASLGVSASIEAVELQYRINTPTGFNFPMLLWFD